MITIAMTVILLKRQLEFWPVALIFAGAVDYIAIGLIIAS